MAKKPDATGNLVFEGIPAAPGIAVGPACRLERPIAAVEERAVPPTKIEEEISRFRRALASAKDELLNLRETTRKNLGEDQARIFDVQLMVLEDPLAVDRTVEAIRGEAKNAEFLFRRHMLEVTENLAALSDNYFSERAADLQDVKQRVLRHLTGRPTSEAECHGVILGREIAPSQAVLLDPQQVQGVATDGGGSTSHAAIMARARGIPAVVGARGLSAAVRDGDVVAVDGFRGRVVLNPTPETLESLQKRRRAFRRLQRNQAKLSSTPAETIDRRRITLAANMEIPGELDMIHAGGAEGIGLFRTEFFFMWSRRAPTEEEQFRVYRDVLKGMKGAEVVFRVLDVGGDKIASYMGFIRERNPFLGMRGIRYLVAHPEIFRAQLKAILRAAGHGPASILFPMVSSLDEFRYARELTVRAMAALKRRKERVTGLPPLGVMIEVPSAVIMAEELAQEADFLTVGSNDLIQYLLAIDRDHESLHALYQPLHPAVLRALKTTVEAAHRFEKPVSICGEMAGDILAVPLLLGLGFDRLSVSPSRLPEVKQIVRSVSMEECRRVARDALDCTKAEEVELLVESTLGSHFSGLLDLIHQSNGLSIGAGRRGARKPGSSTRQGEGT